MNRFVLPLILHQWVEGPMMRRLLFFSPFLFVFQAQWWPRRFINIPVGGRLCSWVGCHVCSLGQTLHRWCWNIFWWRASAVWIWWIKFRVSCNRVEAASTWDHKGRTEFRRNWCAFCGWMALCQTEGIEWQTVDCHRWQWERKRLQCMLWLLEPYWHCGQRGLKPSSFERN